MEIRFNEEEKERLIAMFGKAEFEAADLDDAIKALNPQCIIEAPILRTMKAFNEPYRKAIESIAMARCYFMEREVEGVKVETYTLGFGIHDNDQWAEVLKEIFGSVRVSPKTFSAGGEAGSALYYPVFKTKREWARYWYDNFYSLPRVRARLCPIVPARIRKYLE